ncbi:MAG: Na(+)-translocating NADH-quinone reductase subunit A [Rhodobacter sp.]|nr:Na(+)-translocating NADH-quinone reductase subunit A [Rhodobacter sp.]
MTHHFRRGLDIVIGGAPAQSVMPGNAVENVAVFGGDHRDMRTEVLVAEGDGVARGDPVFRDRKRPEVVIVAPAAGRVETIEIGPKRRLSVLRIRREGAAARELTPPTVPTRDSIAELVQRCGLWPSLIVRPFGRIPTPGTAPNAIFVTAMETDPLAADARVVVAARRSYFQVGLRALRLLSDGPVFVCQGPGPALAETEGKFRIERFAGAHPAGLPGTHIDRLHPHERGGTVWQIHAQDVIALGSVMTEGVLPETRIVALGGPGLNNPRLVEAPEGASLDDLVRDELRGGQMRVISGSPLSGREASHLRRGHHQVSVLPRSQPRLPGRRWWPRHAAALRPAPVVPTLALGRALGPDLPVVPLIRALSVGDVETADRLGCRALLEEDLALATYAAGGSKDFGALLRQALDTLEEQP